MLFQLLLKCYSESYLTQSNLTSLKTFLPLDLCFQAFCYSGNCVPSADTQCRDLWGPGRVISDKWGGVISRVISSCESRRCFWEIIVVFQDNFKFHTKPSRSSLKLYCTKFFLHILFFGLVTIYIYPEVLIVLMVFAVLKYRQKIYLDLQHELSFFNK